MSSFLNKYSLVLSILILGTARLAYSGQSANYQVWPERIGSAGDYTSSPSHQVLTCIGQPLAENVTNTQYNLQSGFLSESVSGSLQATSTPVTAATPTPVPSAFFKVINGQINPVLGQAALIRWAQPQAGTVSLRIFDLTGKKIVTLIDRKNYSANQVHELEWKGVGVNGHMVASGIYVVLLEYPGYSGRTKIAVIK